MEKLPKMWLQTWFMNPDDKGECDKANKRVVLDWPEASDALISAPGSRKKGFLQKMSPLKSSLDVF